MVGGLQLRFKEFLWSDIADIDHDAVQSCDVQAVGSGTLGVTPGAIAMPDAKLNRCAAIGRLENGFEGLLPDRAVIGVNQFQCVGADEGVDLVSKDPLDRGADVANGGGCIHNADDLEPVFDKEPEAL